MYDLILVDFSWIYNKYYYVAKVRPLREDNSPEAIGATACDMLLQFFRRISGNYPEAHIMLALDPPTTTTGNYSLCEDYKQNRNKEEKKEVYSAFKDIVGTLSKKLNSKCSFVRAVGFEADQVISYLAEQYQTSHSILIFSGDKDLLQLTYYENVDISDKFEKGTFLIKSDEEIFGKFKNNKGEDFTRVSNNKKDILKYRVLKGDPSDNLKPVFPRIKDSEIISIIQNYWIDEEVLTDIKIDYMIEDIRSSNKDLAEKLDKNREVWLRNYKIMNLYGLKGLKVKKVKAHG